METKQRNVAIVPLDEAQAMNINGGIWRSVIGGLIAYCLTNTDDVINSFQAGRAAANAAW